MRRTGFAAMWLLACLVSAEAARGDEPRRLIPDLPYRFAVSGWVSAGATVNAREAASSYNGSLTFNDRHRLTLNQLYLVTERRAGEGDGGVDWGARLDLLFGTDFIFTESTGLETTRDGAPKWNSSDIYGLAMPQLYGEVTIDGVSVKLGHFYSIIGYESVMTTSDFFYSIAYTFQYGEPFTHTGLLARWDREDTWTFYGGLVNGWNQTDGRNNDISLLGGLDYAPAEKTYSLLATAIAGKMPNADDQPKLVAMYSLVFDWNITEKVEYVIQHDYGRQDDYETAPGSTVDAVWYGINQYAYYAIDDRWKAGARVEWFRDVHGTEVTGTRPPNPYPGSSSGSFFGVTLGVSWSATRNLMVRSEARWDKFDGTGTKPFDDNTRDSQFTAAVNAVVWF